MSKFVLTSQARLDLLEIWNYVAEGNIDAADRVKSDLQIALNKLADMPGLGHVRTDLADAKYRFWTVYSYVIIYKLETEPLQIIAILHGARDLRAFFDADG